jgi:hypothetical protein
MKVGNAPGPVHHKPVKEDATKREKGPPKAPPQHAAPQPQRSERREGPLPENEPGQKKNPEVGDLANQFTAGGPGNPKVHGSTTKAGIRNFTVHKVESRKAGYNSYNVTVDGTQGKQTMPVDVSQKGKTAKIEDVARGLAASPEIALAATKSVHLEAEGSGPKGVAGLAKSDGTVLLYGCVENPVPPLLHETGHQVARAARGGRIPGMKDLDERWKQAEAKDGRHISPYAKTNAGEDFADTWKFYQRIKGTPKGAEERKKYPARFEILDELMKKSISHP